MSRRTRSCVLLALALAAGAACSDDPLAPLPRSGPPTQMEFVTSGYFAPFIKYRAEGDSVLYYHRPWGAQAPADSIWLRPSEERWRAFWAAAREAGVERWQRRYVAEGIVDGTGWGLLIQTGDRELVSSGINAWPDRLGREHEGEVTPDFSAFVQALDALIGREF